MRQFSALGLLLATFSMPAYSALNIGTVAPNFVTQASLGGEVFTYSLADALK
jgi:peroxiredoxin Q/BCP